MSSDCRWSRPLWRHPSVQEPSLSETPVSRCCVTQELLYGRGAPAVVGLDVGIRTVPLTGAGDDEQRPDHVRGQPALTGKHFAAYVGT